MELISSTKCSRAHGRQAKYELSAPRFVSPGETIFPRRSQITAAEITSLYRTGGSTIVSIPLHTGDVYTGEG